MQVPFVPMEPVPWPEPFDDPNWRYEVKWDGVRCIALVEGGRVRLFSRRLRERTGRFPELQALPGLLGGPVPAGAGGRTVLDGELVVLRDDGRPSFNRILERDLAGPAAAARRSREHPATFVAFDLVQWADADLSARPLAERQARLRTVLRPAPPLVLLSESFTSGRDLFRAVAEQELEGIVGKAQDSPYRPGERSRHWRKVKRRLSLAAVVGGYTVTGGRLGALLLGAHADDGRLQYIGRAGSGLTAADAALVQQHLPVAGRSPFAPNPADPGGHRPRAFRFGRQPDAVVWCQPQLVVQVEFSEWTADGLLRAPVCKGFLALPPTAARLP